MKWDNPQTLYTCGYDMYVRKWDMRIGKLVQSWDDPYLSTVYCLDTDHCYTVISGTSTHGRTVLWDTRTNKSIQVRLPYILLKKNIQFNNLQIYFMNTCKGGRSSPIYSLSFDSSHLITATDMYLNFLNFSVRDSPVKSYNINYYQEIIVYD